MKAALITLAAIALAGCQYLPDGWTDNATNAVPVVTTTTTTTTTTQPPVSIAPFKGETYSDIAKMWTNPLEHKQDSEIANVQLHNGYLSFDVVSGVTSWTYQKDSDGDKLIACIVVCFDHDGDGVYDLTITEFIKLGHWGNSIHLERMKHKPKSGDKIRVFLSSPCWAWKPTEPKRRTNIVELEI